MAKKKKIELICGGVGKICEATGLCRQTVSTLTNHPKQTPAYMRIMEAAKELNLIRRF